ncbi:MAG: radical SAM family heme chaperone HemW [Oscillospiraceae bacterium]
MVDELGYNMDTENLGVYVHIPFCRSNCKYCDFNSYAGVFGKQNDYTRSLVTEIERTGFMRKVDTIYIGGGTPTAIENMNIIKILKALDEKYVVTRGAEITIECNPATIDEEGFRSLRNHGINRVSIGLQSTDDALLKKLGRIHSLDDFECCYNSARNAGFENISFDLMFGLPDQTFEMWRETLEKAITFGAEHISCYSLKIEEGTPFYDMDLNLPDDDENRDMYDLCVDMLEKAGYERYEISNFAKKGYESKHNLKYWKCDDFVGFGAGAFSGRCGYRYSNISDLDEYMDSINARGHATEYAEKLSKLDQMSEFMFLGLRKSEGVSFSEFEKRFGVNIDEIFGGVICKNLMRGTMERNDDRTWIKSDMLYISNSIMVDFV